jgi:hypothetical protein
MDATVAAFLRGAPLPPPFAVAPVGAYRALCRPEADAAGLRVILLAGQDGAVYVPAPAGDPPGAVDLEGLEGALRRQRLRPTDSSLALRLPAALTGGAPRPARFTLWASPAYLAAGGGGGALWK